MKRRLSQRAWTIRSAISLLGVGFVVGALTLAAAQGQFSGGRRMTAGGAVDAAAAAAPAREAPKSPAPATPAARSVATSGVMIPADVATLRLRGLEVPVEGARREDVTDQFHQARGSREHEAVDILAPRGTPVLAVEDGRIARLFLSKAGGITIYQFDPTEHYTYYYAHLDRYAEGLTEGQTVRRGQVIGYVGTTGNAPKNTPHLHFAISKLDADKRWWEGEPIDPFLVYRP
jgi:murein DD-endopeptidase MepM/ murein hydrolase activator NlpD